MSLNDNSNERQPGRTARVCASIVRRIAVVFHGDIRDRQLERSTYSGWEQVLKVVSCS